MAKVWFRELPSFQTHKLTYENSMLGAFSCNVTVVANDVIMQRTQQCLGLYETHQLNPYIVIWLKVVKIHQHAKFQAIPSMCSPANAWKPLRTDGHAAKRSWLVGWTDGPMHRWKEGISGFEQTGRWTDVFGVFDLSCHEASCTAYLLLLSCLLHIG